MLRAIGERLLAARRVVLTTHVNADGDGAGSESAVAAWLEAAGAKATIVNPTPFPEALNFLPHRPDVVADLGSAEGEAALRAADLVLVLDTSEPNRVGALAERIDPDRTIVLDHHPAGPSVVGSLALQDPTAAAAGELVYDLIRVNRPIWTPTIQLGIYVALVSDTGSFRFSNTSPRTHMIAAEMISRGVEPETVFRRLFATFPRRKLDLLGEALGTLRVDPDAGVSWMVLPRSVDARLHTTTEDYEGLIDHARSIEGTEVAVLFRETPEGETKISFRSNGAADVNRIARQFGGGGHVKAAGAVVDSPPDQTVEPVLRRVREEVNRITGQA